MDTIDSVSGVLEVDRSAALGRLRATTQTSDVEATSFSNVLDIEKSENALVESKPLADANAQFEKMVISQMLGEIFQEQTEGAFGEGMQGDFYKSLFTDAIAEQLIKKGGLGIAKIL